MLCSIAWETFTTLRRDRIFLPAIIAGFILLYFITLIGGLTIEESGSIYYEMGLMLFNLTGCLVAILWGTKIITDSRAEGAINLQLAAPMDRHFWLLAKYLGLCLSLIVLGSLIGLMWIVVMNLDDNLRFQAGHIAILAMNLLGWLVLGALAILMTSFASQMVSIFLTLGLWIIGLLAEPARGLVHDQTTPVTSAVVKVLLKTWNFHNFDYSNFAHNTETLPGDQMALSLIQGVLMILGLISVSAVIFRKKDLV